MDVVYIYGAGLLALREFKRISDNYIVNGFIVTDPAPENRRYLNIPVFSLDEISDQSIKIIICSSFHVEIKTLLNEKGFKNIIQIQDLASVENLTGDRLYIKSDIDSYVNLSLESVSDLIYCNDILSRDDIIVSLTSFRPRFQNLHVVIKSLKKQSIKPFKILLWIAEQDYDFIPEKVRKEQDGTFIIKSYKDIKSYKKLIPSLINYSSYTIVTADDDLYYWFTWLEELVTTASYYPDCVVAHRVHRINPEKLNEYSSWAHCSNSENTKKPDIWNFPTTGGGVLFKPHCFYKDVLKEKIFNDICPTADDIWFYWMLRLNGKKVVSTGRDIKFIPIKTKGSPTLDYVNNYNNQNDVQLANMIRNYGNVNL